MCPTVFHRRVWIGAAPRRRFVGSRDRGREHQTHAEPVGRPPTYWKNINVTPSTRTVLPSAAVRSRPRSEHVAAAARQRVGAIRMGITDTSEHGHHAQNVLTTRRIDPRIPTATVKRLPMDSRTPSQPHPTPTVQIDTDLNEPERGLNTNRHRLPTLQVLDSRLEYIPACTHPRDSPPECGSTRVGPQRGRQGADRPPAASGGLVQLEPLRAIAADVCPARGQLQHGAAIRR